MLIKPVAYVIMKIFNTSRTIRLNNIESFEKVKIGSTFFNFTKDISTPRYELIDKKFYLLVLDDDEPNHNRDNPNYIIEKVEIKPEDWFKSKYDSYNKYDIKDDYCGDVVIDLRANLLLNLQLKTYQQMRHSLIVNMNVTGMLS